MATIANMRLVAAGASGSRPIRRNDRAAAPKGPTRSYPRLRVRSAIATATLSSPRARFIEGRRAADEALRTGFPIKCAHCRGRGARCRLCLLGRRPQRRGCPH